MTIGFGVGLVIGALMFTSWILWIIWSAMTVSRLGRIARTLEDIRDATLRGERLPPTPDKALLARRARLQAGAKKADES